MFLTSQASEEILTQVQAVNNLKNVFTSSIRAIKVHFVALNVRKWIICLGPVENFKTLPACSQS